MKSLCEEKTSLAEEVQKVLKELTEDGKVELPDTLKITKLPERVVEIAGALSEISVEIEKLVAVEVDCILVSVGEI